MDFPSNPTDWDYVWAGLNLAAANADAAVDPVSSVGVDGVNESDIR